jgi:hypothetical protein
MSELTAKVRPNSHLIDMIVNELEDLLLTHIDYFDRQISQ